MDDMQCYELTLTPNYVQDWGLNDAIRELIQNGTDQQIIDNTNIFKLEYDEDKEELHIINTKSKLNINTLLLGRSSKANNDDTVGKFGEGYKIASLVLNRLDKTFTIYNNERNELWTSKFKNSKKWNDKILAFYVSKNETTDTGLDIVIGNITEDEYYEIENVWLGTNDTYKRITTDYGEILTDEEQKGKVYVNGLSVDIRCDLEYGYNFKAKYITLERDRKTCDAWNARFYTSKMLAQAMVNGDIEINVIKQMVERDSDDIYQMDMMNNDTEHVKKMLIEQFDKQNDTSIAIPVRNEEESRKVRAFGGVPVVVPYRVGQIMSSEINDRIEALSENPLRVFDTLKEQFIAWVDIYGNNVGSTAKQELLDLINKL